jgi:sugar phosphate isomerase/epimerase
MAKHPLGIEFISVFGLPPVEFVHLAADLGCRHISTALIALQLESLGYPPFSLKDDAALRRELLAAMADRDVSISLGEGMVIRPGADVSALAPELDIMAELGAAQVNSVSFDRDLDRTFDQLALLTRLASERGLRTTIEMAPGTVIGDLPTALAAIEHCGTQLQLCLDTMHWARSGYGAADIDALDPNVIGYVQLSDTTMAPRLDSYLEEAMYERMAPGDGELPLRDILAAVAPDVVVGLEVPMRGLAEAGVSAVDRLRPCVAGARELMS